MIPLGTTMASTPAEKVWLFRAMFRGREDVYAKRWENDKTGKCGYSPACEAEWIRGVCDKKRIACAVCPNRRLTTVDDDVVVAHLRGKDARGRPFTMGVYPFLADDSVRFAVLDFDKKSWRADSWSVCKIVEELGLPVARERSRSGNGAHLWFFFEEPYPARFAREVLIFVLSLAMERNPEIPFGPNAYMEIDLLCVQRKIAIEIDGDFHFETRENYRRDRRKDLLLQKASYLVLRFLAGDVVERADTVLSTILGVIET